MDIVTDKQIPEKDIPAHEERARYRKELDTLFKLNDYIKITININGAIIDLCKYQVVREAPNGYNLKATVKLEFADIASVIK